MKRTTTSWRREGSEWYEAEQLTIGHTCVHAGQYRCAPLATPVCTRVSTEPHKRPRPPAPARTVCGTGRTCGCVCGWVGVGGGGRAVDCRTHLCAPRRVPH
eukprot:3852900-Rhodomonas_salina.1